MSFLLCSVQYTATPKAVLEAWVFAHFDAPYPNDHDKNLLASLTGMPRAQVCCARCLTVYQQRNRSERKTLSCEQQRESGM